jgi:integrase
LAQGHWWQGIEAWRRVGEELVMRAEPAADLLAGPATGPGMADPGPDVAVLGQHAAALEALTVLSARADAHAREARSPRTRALYARDWAHFTGWCDLVGHRALPAEVDTLRWYLTDLEAARTETGAQAYQPATLARRLAAIAAAHRDAGHLSPTRDPRVHAVLSGIRRTRRHTPHRMQPLLLDEVKTLLGSMDYASWPAGVTATRDAFILLAGFAGALRRSELAALTLADLTWHPSDGLYLRIRSSKTDQEALGATLALPVGEHPQTCPPCAFLRWVTLLDANRRGRPALMHAVFATPSWDNWAHLCQAPQPGQAPNAPTLLASLPARTPLVCAIRKGATLTSTAITGDGLHRMVKRRAHAAGIPGPVGFHSLRAGFVTQARRAGADTRAVRRQTRHSSDAMVELYDRDHAPLLGNAVTQLGL